MNSLQSIFHDDFENSREICIQYIFHVIKNLHKEMHICFPTIGDDRSRQYAADAGVLAAVLRFWIHKTWLVETFSYKSSMNSLQYIFHDFFENSSEIYIQYIFHVIKNLHKEMHILFSTVGDDGSRQ